MSKDPAFLFYPGDWLGGTTTFTRAHKGAYMDLLMAQFNHGHMSIQEIKIILCNDFNEMWESVLKRKFKVDDKGLYYNEKLENEMIKRKAFTESRRKNLEHHKASHMDSHMDSHMENENENVNINKDKTENKTELDFNKFFSEWNELADKTGLSKITEITNIRKKKLIARGVKFVENWNKILSEISSSDFLLGKTDKWKVSFDWVIENDSNWIKIIEGNYKPPEQKKKSYVILSDGRRVNV